MVHLDFASDNSVDCICTLTSLADNGSDVIVVVVFLVSVEGSSHPDRFAAAPPGDDVADKVVEPELEELASSRLSGRGGGDAGLPATKKKVKNYLTNSPLQCRV